MNDKKRLVIPAIRESAYKAVDTSNADLIVPTIKDKARKLSKEKTGLPDDIWFDEAGAYRWFGDDSPYVLVGSEYKKAIPVTISQNPITMTGDAKASKMLDKDQWLEIYSLISRNHDSILQHWNGDIGFQAMKRQLLM